MAQKDLLIHTVETLNTAGIAYMVTGSMVTSLQGEPRSTHDIDVVVSITAQDVPQLLSAFERPRFYVDEGAVREAIRCGGMFNVIEAEEGDKVDFWMLHDDPFDQSRFQRRYVEHVFGINMVVSRPEDTILAKLRWAKLSGGSGRHIQDVVGVYEVQGPRLDHSYLEGWAVRLGVTELLAKVKEQAGSE